MKDTSFLINNDINVEASLELLGDMDTYNEIMGEFVEHFGEKIELIKKYLDQHDMPNYVIQVHSLKSDAKYLGMKELADKAFEHEMKSKGNDEAFVLSDINNLLQIAAKYDDIAKEYLGANRFIDTSEGGAQAPLNAILIADDSNIIRSIAEKMIGSNYTLLQAQDGQEAIKLVDENKEILRGMLLDLNMPNVNGFSVLQHFKDNNLFATIPVAIITGDDSKETIMKAFDYPIVDVLAKPFNENDVKRVLSTMNMNK